MLMKLDDIYTTMTSFSNILIPVDTFENSYVAVQRALELSNSPGTTIHLVTVIRQVNVFTKLFTRLTGHQTEKIVRKKIVAREELQKIRVKANQFGKTTHFVSVVVIKNSFRSFLNQYFLSNRIDLVIKSEKTSITESTLFSTPFFFLVSERTGIPVLTILQGETVQLSKSILFPVTDLITERNAREVLGMARKYNAQIHIITILNDSESNMKQHFDSFYLAYKLFSDLGHSPQYKIMIGRHKEELMLRYAQKHNLSMIFINCNKRAEPFITIGRNLLRAFQPVNKIHVLNPRGDLKSLA